VRGRFGSWNWECGLRPLRAVGSRLYEPEAVGAIGAYSPTRRARVYEPEAAPEGRRERKKLRR
jgi:hypothetical protein